MMEITNVTRGAMDWVKYQEIAKRFEHKAKAEDREDLRQDIILRLAEVESNNGHKPLSEPAMLRVASYTVLAYWRDLSRKPTMLSLNSPIEDEDGNAIELYQIIADDRAVDLEAWLDAKRWLLGCPKRLVRIAFKKVNGKVLTKAEYSYLEYQRQKELKKYQKVLEF